ncbi:hypothetical protein OHB56_40520 [Streptomyces sp. NBC_01635]|uniref:hypothetical protein n=1 Tax=Streptomyces sp. NBC_01635 TaxID=2975904 RepID=UPI0038693A71|nr:hypothetical protein OHB56_00385 [Streptomyces sp. NBC_01635]WTD79529.1 hypothetical protein OHB56_40520 [Streptomyces sp. NBC_01635]
MNAGFRRLGYDAATGKTAYARTEPGGFLDAMADVAALETATVWHTLAGAMTDGPQLSADEANFVLARVVEALGEVLPIAMRAVNADGTVARYAEAGRDIGTAVRDMKP